MRRCAARHSIAYRVKTLSRRHTLQRDVACIFYLQGELLLRFNIIGAETMNYFPNHARCKITAPGVTEPSLIGAPSKAILAGSSPKRSDMRGQLEDEIVTMALTLYAACAMKASHVGQTAHRMQYRNHGSGYRAPFGVIEDGAIRFRTGASSRSGDGSIWPVIKQRRSKSLNGTWVTPGLVDCHTHLFSAAIARANSNCDCKARATKKSPGRRRHCHRSVAATRAASLEQLTEQAPRAPRGLDAREGSPQSRSNPATASTRNRNQDAARPQKRSRGERECPHRETRPSRPSRSAARVQRDRAAYVQLVARRNDPGWAAAGLSRCRRCVTARTSALRAEEYRLRFLPPRYERAAREAPRRTAQQSSTALTGRTRMGRCPPIISNMSMSRYRGDG